MKRYLVVTLLLLICFASWAAAQVSEPVRVRTSDKIMQGLIIKKIAPVYPPLARQARIQGLVVMKVLISKTGDVENIQLFSGHPILAPSAIEAVKQWKYKPYLLNGEPVEVETNVTVNFTLPDKPPAEGVVGDMPGGVPEGEKGGIAPGTEGTPTQPAVSGRVRVSPGVEQGLVVTKVPPQYPPEAKDAHIQGVVLMNVIVDKEGNVANVQLISGHPLLAPAAIDAVKQWKYKPYLLNETPVEVETQVHVNFTLMP
ncbi:MAG: energy transducer TonB [Candidatus Sulfotelmatobacter sp.]